MGKAKLKVVKKGKAPNRWAAPCVHNECTLHQLSPYIGKIKSSIAGELISKYTEEGDTIIDPFCGAGTIPLEAKIKNRNVIGSDISNYSKILTIAKIAAPRNLDEALKLAYEALQLANKNPLPNLKSTPKWVKSFFHPKTLREVLRFAEICRKPGNEFLMACLLGILHHQRPGFLSYPSSHLVPYLRDKKYPKNKFPEMYKYRDIESRLLAKIKRAYKRVDPSASTQASFKQSLVEEILIPKNIDAIITSPPYMNALDYGRDNRLRLWLINPCQTNELDNIVAKQKQAFINAMTSLAIKVEKSLKRNGYCVFIIGEAGKRSYKAHPSVEIQEIIKNHAPSLHLRNIISDKIPDIRRARKTIKGIKNEHFLVYKKIP